MWLAIAPPSPIISLLGAHPTESKQLPTPYGHILLVRRSRLPSYLINDKQRLIYIYLI